MGSLFQGKTVIVTGAGLGIGREEALAFAREGARVVVNDVGKGLDANGKEVSSAELVVREIEALGGEAVASTSSVADLDGAEMVVWTALSRFGRVDALVNNAGILRDRSLVNMSEADWDAVIAVHLKGTFLMTRAFARAIKVQGGSGYAVVNTTSISGFRGNYGQANYGAAKAGVFGLTRVLAAELPKLGGRANAIAPVALTRMTEKLPVMKGQSLETMGPQHIAPVAVWLASPLSAELNGRVIGVEGSRVFEYRMMTSEGQARPPSGDTWSPESLAASWGDIALREPAPNASR